MRPGAGAFTLGGPPQPAAAPQQSPAPQAAAPLAGPPMPPQAGQQSGQSTQAFLQQLQSLGLIPGQGGPAPGGQMPPPGGQMPPGAMPPGGPPAGPPPGPGQDPLAQLAAMTAGMPKGPPEGPPPQKPRPAKAQFEPGVPGAPRSGMSVHQMMRDPDLVSMLEQKIAAWQAENPGRQLMGTHIQEMLPEVSAAQARNLKKHFMRRKADSVVADGPTIEERLRRASMNTVLGR